MSATRFPDRLSVVAVPIGNIKDLTPRALEALSMAHLIFCEDTRKTTDLLKRCGISSSAKLISVPGDAEHEVDWIRYCSPDYRNWAVVSDAGTPVVNDPGISILSFCQKHGIRIEALPGASAPILAWQWSGGFGLPFVFGGFAPKVSSTSTSKWDRFVPKTRSGTFCFFDTRHQIVDTLTFMASSYPKARLHIAREMTKSHEELISGNPAFLLDYLKKLLESDRVGELCVLIDLASLQPEAQLDEAIPEALNLSLEELLKFRGAQTKEASKMIAKWCGMTPRDAYKRLCDDET